MWWSAPAVIAQLTPYLLLHWRRTMISGFDFNITHQEQCGAGAWYELWISLLNCRHSAQNVCWRWGVWEATLLSLANTDGISIILQPREEAPPSIYDHSEMKSGSSPIIQLGEGEDFVSNARILCLAITANVTRQSILNEHYWWGYSGVSSLYHCCQATAKGLIWEYIL